MNAVEKRIVDIESRVGEESIRVDTVEKRLDDAMQKLDQESPAELKKKSKRFGRRYRNLPGRQTMPSNIPERKIWDSEDYPLNLERTVKTLCCLSVAKLSLLHCLITILRSPISFLYSKPMHQELQPMPNQLIALLSVSSARK